MMPKQIIKNERKAFFRILNVASRFEARLQKQAWTKNQRRRVRYYVWTFEVVPFSTAVLFFLAFPHVELLKKCPEFGLSALLIFYLGVLLHPIFLAWVNQRALLIAFRHPLGLFLNNACITAIVDSWVLPRLMRISIEHLELLLLELKSEKEFFERRLLLMVGAVEKVGLFPGLLAISVSLSTAQPNRPEWVVAIAYAYPILFVAGVAAHYLLMRLDRNVRLVELSVGRKKAVNISFSA